ncbi:MAG: hypothetical protein AABY93_14885 [Bacteroidota bacterium]
MQELKKLYAGRQAEFSLLGKEVNRSLRSISLGRIVVALLFIVITYLGFSQSILFYTLPFVGAGFFYLVSLYNKGFQKSQLLENLVKLNSLEQKALDHDFSNFKSGERFLDPHHAYSYDLDLFGNGSLFQYLNRCGTTIGENKLADLLLTPRSDRQSIYDRQDAIKDLHDKIQFRQDFWAHAILNKSNAIEIETLLDWLKQENFIEGKLIYRILLTVGPLIAISLLVVTIINTAWMPALLLAMALQWTIASFHSQKISRIQDALGKHKHVLERYAVLLKLVLAQDFKSTFLISLKNEAWKASVNVRKFSNLVNALESRMNAIATMFGNSLFLYDLHSVRRLERWRHVNAADLPRWLDVVAEADALCSFGTFHFNNPSYAFPSVDEKLNIRAEQLGHPLIASVERIGNDFSQGNPETIMIITGANMAGKSTFLRAAGVNVILSLAGAPVCAKNFSCPIIGLRSGMRTSDSLQEHQSYFYAELYRLQCIMDDLRAGQPLLILLDEILKGTNSTDKQSGSIAIVEQLVKLNALVLLATHDVVLGELQERFPGRVINGCFESQVEGARLAFDYKLKPGIAQKANATFLMKQMGIIPD